MAQPRLTFALACDGLISPWFGQVDEDGTFWNGTLFAGSIMTLIASFVPLEFLNDLISAGVLVAFSMTNSSLLLLRLESPDTSEGLLEKLLTCFNIMCFVTSLMLNYICTSLIGKILTGVCCFLTLTICILLKQWCPAASYFGGKTRRSTTQHMTVGIRSVEESTSKVSTPIFYSCHKTGIFVIVHLLYVLVVFCQRLGWSTPWPILQGFGYYPLILSIWKPFGKYDSLPLPWSLMTLFSRFHGNNDVNTAVNAELGSVAIAKTPCILSKTYNCSLEPLVFFRIIIFNLGAWYTILQLLLPLLILWH